MGKKQPKTTVIDPNKIKTRDTLMIALINGATKSGAHRDRRSKLRARQELMEEWDDLVAEEDDD